MDGVWLWLSMFGWFLFGWDLRRWLVPATRIEALRVPNAFDEFPDHLAPIFLSVERLIEESVFDARMSGAGYVCRRKCLITIDGVVVSLLMQCDSNQFAGAPEVERRR